MRCRLMTRHAVGLAALAAASIAPLAPARETTDTRIDPQTASVLTAMDRFLNDVPQFSVSAGVTYDRTLESGQLVEVSEQHEVSVLRPGSLRATVLGADGVRLALVHEQTITLVDPIGQTYFQAEAEGTLGEAVDVMVIDLGLSIPIADLMYENPAVSMTSEVVESRYLGVVPLDGVPCHHLSFRQDGLEWQMWVAAGVHPTPLRLVIHYTDRPGTPRFSASLAWTLNQTQFDESAFTFSPSEGYRAIDDIRRLTQPEAER
ncbi:MAG: DUF2092 domain-containing protein [Planctomycetota bacterium]